MATERPHRSTRKPCLQEYRVDVSKHQTCRTSQLAVEPPLVGGAGSPSRPEIDLHSPDAPATSAAPANDSVCSSVARLRRRMNRMHESRRRRAKVTCWRRTGVWLAAAARRLLHARAFERDSK